MQAALRAPQQYTRFTSSSCRACPSPRRLLRIRATAAGESYDPTVVVSGGGIGGLAVAVGLQRVGVPVVVLERDSERNTGGATIALWQNAVKALDALGVLDRLEVTPSLTRIQMCSPRGVLREFSLSECEGEGHVLQGIRRASLLSTLESSLPEGAVRYGAGVDAVETLPNGGVRLTLSDGSQRTARVVVGADGVRSNVAASLGVPPATLEGYSAYRGVAEFDSESLPVMMDTCRQVLGEGVRAGLYPFSAKDVYWFVCFNDALGARGEGTSPREHALSLVGGWGHGVEACIKATPEESILRNRIADRFLMPGSEVGRGGVTLAGDALHPMTPNLGQGGCCALEDAVVLARALGGVWGRDDAAVSDALRQYEQERLKRAAKITLKANAMGKALQIGFGPVTVVRNTFISKLFSPAHFLSHTEFDCGSLEGARP